MSFICVNVGPFFLSWVYMCLEMIIQNWITSQGLTLGEKRIPSLNSVTWLQFSASGRVLFTFPIDIAPSTCIAILQDLFKQSYSWNVICYFPDLFRRSIPTVDILILWFLPSLLHLPWYFLSLKYNYYLKDLPARWWAPYCHLFSAFWQVVDLFNRLHICCKWELPL